MSYQGTREPVRTGNGGHACHPAGRGLDTSAAARWRCPDCRAQWRATHDKAGPMEVVNWQRSDA